MQTTSDLQAVADAIRSNDRFLLVTHENPDGDALGSLLATKLALDQLGKDSVMYLYGDAPLPREYGFMELSGILREPPPDASERVLVALDCANEARMAPDTTLLAGAPLTLDAIKDATHKVSPAVLEAALVETHTTFRLSSREVIDLDDAGVPDRLIDVLIALSYPKKFVVERASATTLVLPPSHTAS